MILVVILSLGISCEPRESFSWDEMASDDGFLVTEVCDKIVRFKRFAINEDDPNLLVYTFHSEYLEDSVFKDGFELPCTQCTRKVEG